jgi:hypothetical protein
MRLDDTTADWIVWNASSFTSGRRRHTFMRVGDQVDLDVLGDVFHTLRQIRDDVPDSGIKASSVSASVARPGLSHSSPYQTLASPSQAARTKADGA